MEINSQGTTTAATYKELAGAMRVIAAPLGVALLLNEEIFAEHWGVRCMMASEGVIDIITDRVSKVHQVLDMNNKQAKIDYDAMMLEKSRRYTGNVLKVFEPPFVAVIDIKTGAWLYSISTEFQQSVVTAPTRIRPPPATTKRSGPGVEIRGNESALRSDEFAAALGQIGFTASTVRWVKTLSETFCFAPCAIPVDNDFEAGVESRLRLANGKGLIVLRTTFSLFKGANLGGYLSAHDAVKPGSSYKAPTKKKPALSEAAKKRQYDTDKIMDASKPRGGDGSSRKAGDAGGQVNSPAAGTTVDQQPRDPNVADLGPRKHPGGSVAGPREGRSGTGEPTGGGGKGGVGTQRSTRQASMGEFLPPGQQPGLLRPARQTPTLSQTTPDATGPGSALDELQRSMSKKNEASKSTRVGLSNITMETPPQTLGNARQKPDSPECHFSKAGFPHPLPLEQHCCFWTCLDPRCSLAPVKCACPPREYGSTEETAAEETSASPEGATGSAGPLRRSSRARVVRAPYEAIRCCKGGNGTSRREADKECDVHGCQYYTCWDCWILEGDRFDELAAWAEQNPGRVLCRGPLGHARQLVKLLRKQAAEGHRGETILNPVPQSRFLPANPVSSAAPTTASTGGSRRVAAAPRTSVPGAGLASTLPPAVRNQEDPRQTAPRHSEERAVVSTGSANFDRASLDGVFGDVMDSLGFGGDGNSAVDISNLSRAELAALFVNSLDRRSSGAGSATSRYDSAPGAGLGFERRSTGEQDQRHQLEGEGRRSDQRLAPSPEVSRNGALSGREHSR
jgi:hypothetical protein